MITKQFSIYDKISAHYTGLFSAPTLGAAERMFKDSINKPDTIHNAHPQDYDLYYLADFDDETGLFIPFETGQPYLVVRGDSLVN